MSKLCVVLDEDLKAKVEKIREATGIKDKSDVVRLAISELYKKYYAVKQ